MPTSNAATSSATHDIDLGDPVIFARPMSKSLVTAPQDSKLSIPTCVDDFTTEWLNAALARHLGEFRVLGCHAKPFSEPGQTADIVEITLDYDIAGCPLPQRMIAKLSPLDPGTRELTKIYRHFERETAFYGQFCGDDLPIAKCFYTQYDPASLDAVILLEHLEPSYSPSYSVTLDQVWLAVREVARLHAHWWNDDFIKQQAALVQPDDMDHWNAAAEGAFAATPTVRELVGLRCERSIAMAKLFAERTDDIMAYISTRPFTLMHCDYHPKQMFFPNNKGEGKFAVIDFQFSLAGPGAFDVIRLLNLGLATDVRHSSEEEIIAEYLAQLEANGVCGYSREDFTIDQKLGALFTQLINFIAVNQTDQNLLASECADHGLDWKEVWLLRGEEMVKELEIPEFLSAI